MSPFHAETRRSMTLAGTDVAPALKPAASFAKHERRLESRRHVNLRNGRDYRIFSTGGRQHAGNAYAS